MAAASENFGDAFGAGAWMAGGQAFGGNYLPDRHCLIRALTPNGFGRGHHLSTNDRGIAKILLPSNGCGRHKRCRA